MPDKLLTVELLVSERVDAGLLERMRGNIVVVATVVDNSGVFFFSVPPAPDSLSVDATAEALEAFTEMMHRVIALGRAL